jgi:hypothetical protein
MTNAPESTRTETARGLVDNASAFPTTPPAQHEQASRTFESSCRADIFTRHQQPKYGDMEYSADRHPAVACLLMAGAMPGARGR